MGLTVQIINIPELPALAYDEEMIKQLNHLIALHRDVEDGYRIASEIVPNTSLQATFLQNLTQRQRFILELAEIVVQMGGDPDKVNWRGGLAQRQPRQIGAILADFEQHEQRILYTYEKALGRLDLPAYVRKVLSQQASELNKIYQRLCDLRNLYY